MSKIDWAKTAVPLIGIAMLCVLFLFSPEKSKYFLENLRRVLGDDFGIYYAIIGVGVFCFSIWLAFSKYGTIQLGNSEKPRFGNFIWGAMIFSSSLAADIVFFSLSEWMMYAKNPYVQSLGEPQVWVPTLSLFHWGPIAWCFHIILAVCFGFMLHVKNRNRQCFSEACRPLFGGRMDGFWGKAIDIVSIIAMLAGIATTFSLATPLLSAAVCSVFGINNSTTLTILLLLIIAAIYSSAVLFGISGISKLAKWCIYSFLLLLAYVLFMGGEARFIVETGFQSIGNLIQNFVGLSTYMDPLRMNSFPQDWTLYYWAYWMVWTIGTPFFIGLISSGRSIKNTILGGYGWALAGTFSSFIILGNYGLAQQFKHGIDILGVINSGGTYYDAILTVIETLPFSQFAIIILIITMILFYATTFDSLSFIASNYSYKYISPEEEPSRIIRTIWALLFIILPISLIFSENTLYSLQSVSIIAAFPIGLLIIFIIVSFVKDIKSYK